MMRVLDSSLNNTRYDASQFLRGALMYARQNWWMALWIPYVAGSAIYDWHLKSDVRLLFLVALSSFIITFWWIHYPPAKQSGFMTKYGAGAVGLSFALATMGGVGYFTLYFIVIGMAWPWLENARFTPQVIRIYKFAVGLLILGIVSAAIYYLFVLPMMLK